MMLRHLALWAVLAGTAVPAAAADPCWPQWRGPHRDGKAVGQAIRTDWEANPPQQLWKLEGIGDGFASVAIVGEMLYTTGNVKEGQAVTAVDLKSRKIVWQTPITDGVPKHGYPGSRCTPTVDGDRLYVVSSNGGVACLDVTSGEVVWSKTFQSEYGSGEQSWGYGESPLIDGEVVVVTPGGSKALMVALDKSTGKELWRTPYGNLGEAGKKEAGYSSAVVSHAGGVKQYVQLTGKGAIGVQAADGKLLWSYNKVANGVAVIPTPVVKDDYVFVSSGYGTGAALLKLTKAGNGVKAEEVYFLKANDFQNHHGQMILHEGHIYAGRGHNKGFPVCLELESGKVVWGDGERGPGGGSAAVTFVDGHLVFRYQDGVVALIEATPEEYRLKGTFTPEFTEGENWAHPVICNGKLYLRQKGRLMCFDVAG
ncbi:MAG: PQQ-binding-like beta-propeller repeat protein [Planctomycetaceae bacterium]